MDPWRYGGRPFRTVVTADLKTNYNVISYPNKKKATKESSHLIVLVVPNPLIIKKWRQIMGCQNYRSVFYSTQKCSASECYCCCRAAYMRIQIPGIFFKSGFKLQWTKVISSLNVLKATKRFRIRWDKRLVLQFMRERWSCFWILKYVLQNNILELRSIVSAWGTRGLWDL